ncbi:MAG TPA: hypothetical protein VE344_07840 [Methylomirabilota bacterium]|nr:hypothetical protein [Methylomirabilota bacterium]
MKPRARNAGLATGALLLFLIAVLVTGCKTATPLPPMDLSASGWRVQQGQAIWKPPQNRPELAGDLILATNANGNYFIQFSKTPFSIVTAEVEDEQWEIRFGEDKYAWRGGGIPPDHFLWFQLPRAFLGEDLNDGWKFERGFGNLWRLENPETGETFSGEFFP